MTRIPRPEEVSVLHREEHRRKVESLRNRVIEHLRHQGEQDEHRLALHGEAESVVQQVIEECAESGWSARRDRVPVKYGPPISDSGRITRQVIADGRDDLVLVRVEKV